MTSRVRALAERVWRYHHMDHTLVKSDAILVLCSHDIAVAERGAELWLQGWAPLLIFSGGLGGITGQLWTTPEADQFAAVAERMGVPRASMLIENRSTNTGENVRFTRALLAAEGTNPASFILVQKPYMERRAFATFAKVWPDKPAIVTSPQVSFEDYLVKYSNESLSADDVVSIMVGDLQRMKVYAERGFQIPQEIPADVWEAFEALVAEGYDSRLVGA
jgi:uncharacterized SAM-binding protein YcdF (DUF218 family)